MKKQVKIFNNDFSTFLTDISNLKFLDFQEESVEVNANSIDVKGTDGVVLGPSTFGPFNLILNFSFKGVDVRDYNLMIQKLRSMLFKRDVFYVWHSDMPGKKYAVYCNENAIERKTSKFGVFALKLVVFKGYSESYKETDQFSLFNGFWQFEEGLILDDNIKYVHDTSKFKIFNGSDDTINPILRHKFRLDINIDAPNGFTITNKTTGDVFEYTKPLKSKQTLTIQGVHPLLNNQRVGINTNFNFLTLVPGYNDIEISGHRLGATKTKWIFPFIYR